MQIKRQSAPMKMENVAFPFWVFLFVIFFCQRVVYLFKCFNCKPVLVILSPPENNVNFLFHYRSRLQWPGPLCVCWLWQWGRQTFWPSEYVFTVGNQHQKWGELNTVINIFLKSLPTQLTWDFCEVIKYFTERISFWHFQSCRQRGSTAKKNYKPFRG